MKDLLLIWWHTSGYGIYKYNKEIIMKVYGMMIHKIHLELKNRMIILIIKENIIMGKKWYWILFLL